MSLEHVQPLVTSLGEVNVVRRLRSTPGITTVLGTLAPGDDLVVVRQIDLQTAQPWNSEWLLRDLGVLAEVASHHLVPTRVADVEAESLFVVRGFVDGWNLREWATRGRAVSVEACTGMFRQFFVALAELHEQGIVHGGLHEENVFVSADESSLLLTDGLVTRSQLAGADISPGSAPGLSVGAPSKQAIGFSADLWAAGWLFLASLGDRWPKAGAQPGHATTATSVEEAMKLIEALGASAEYRSILGRLLNPLDDRAYSRAEDVVAALDALDPVGALPRAAQPSPVDPAEEIARTQLLYLDPPLVGRTTELELFDGYLQRAAEGAGLVVCLIGEPGVGKTKLLEAVVSRAGSSGLQVLRAGAFHRTAQRPLGLFSGIFADLVDLLLARPETAARVRDELGPLVMPIVALVPELARVFTPVAVVDQDEGWAADAVTSAAARLLGAVFAELGPGLIVLDDCQWADASSLQLVAKIAAAVGTERDTSGKLTLLCSFRADGDVDLASLGDEAEVVELEALDRDEVKALILLVAGDTSEELVDYVVGHSRGNPLSVLTILRALVDSSQVRQEQARWVLGDKALRGLPAPPLQVQTFGRRPRGERRATASFVHARIDGLPPETLHALCQAAVLGHRFSVSALSGALRLDRPRCQALLTPAVARGVLEDPLGEGVELQFAHDQLRDAVLESCGPVHRELHAKAAAVLSAAPRTVDDFAVAYHFDQAGDTTSAVPYALRAAEGALKQSFLDLAFTNFRIAETGIASGSGTDSATRLRVLRGLGTVHMLRGNYEPAEAALSTAYEIAEGLDDLERPRIAVLLEELAFKDGRIEDAEVWRGRVARDLGIRFPRTTAAVVVALAVELLRLLVSPLDRRRAVAKSPGIRTRDQLKAQLYTRLLFEYWFSQPRLWLTLMALRAFRTTRRSVSVAEKAQMYAAAAVIMAGCMPPLSGLAQKLADRSWRWRQEMQDGWGIAQSHHFRGFVLHCGERYAEAIVAFDNAIETFEIVGDRWEELAARWQKALCLYRLGRLHEAGALARETYHAAKRIGDRIAAGTALAIWTRCLPNEVSSELISRELGLIGPADHHTRALLTGAGAWRSFNDGHHADALESLASATRELRRAGIRNHFVAPLSTWRLQILRQRCDVAPGWDPKERRRRYRAARRQLRRSLASALVFQAELPSVLREWAILSFARGRTRRGRWLLAKALRVARRRDCGGEVAACLFVAAAARGAKDGGKPSPSVDSDLCRRLRIRVDRGFVEASTLHPQPVIAGNSTMRQEFPDSIRRIVSAAGREEILVELRAASHLLTPARAVLFQPAPPVVRGEGASAAAERGPEDRISVPVVAFGVTSVVMVVDFPEGKARDFAMTVEVLAGLAGAALEREQLRKESLERIVAVQEAERGRVARDLHDEFGSLFTGILDGAGVLDRLENDEARRVSGDVRRLAMEGVFAVRSMAWGLRPAGLEHFGLPGSVEQYIEDCERRSGIRMELTTDGDAWSTLPAELKIGLFRIIQEALTNVDRHSGATEASVLLVASDAVLRAVIEDNGVGFDVAGSDETSHSLGIMGMGERARLLGGRVTLESQRGRGTTVLVEVPLQS